MRTGSQGWVPAGRRRVDASKAASKTRSSNGAEAPPKSGLWHLLRQAGGMQHQRVNEPKRWGTGSPAEASGTQRTAAGQSYGQNGVGAWVALSCYRDGTEFRQCPAQEDDGTGE